MIKTIKIDNKEIQLNNSIGWTIEYRDQFETDIIPAIMPLIASGMDIISEILRETGKTKDITVEDILAALDGDALVNAIVHLGSFEFVDFLNIVWALAKNADEDIPDPKTWIKSFDNFPVDEVAPEVVKLVLTGVMSSKNLKRLNDLKKTVQTNKASTLTPLSSPDSSEA